MSRETLEAKAARLLATGRLCVLEVGPDVVRAVCRGDSGRLHRLGWSGAWACSCMAGQLNGRCAHMIALRLVVAEPTPVGAEPGLTPARMRLEQAEANRVRAGSSRG
jgi:hypothetical protein